MSEETPKEKVRCNICNRERDLEFIPCPECGTCVYCLADLGDPTAKATVDEECRENGGYRGIDSVVISGLVAEKPKPECESTTEECDKCSKLVWVSTGTRADAERTAKKNGGNVVYLCMGCVPESIVGSGMRVGTAQIDEMRIAGIDVEKIVKESGMTLEEIARRMLQWAKARHGAEKQTDR